MLKEGREGQHSKQRSGLYKATKEDVIKEQVIECG